MRILKLLVLLAAAACGKTPENPSPGLPMPGELEVLQLSESSARLSWDLPSPEGRGYWVFVRGEGSAFHVEPQNMHEPLPAGTSSYEFTSLAPGRTYTFGVQSLAGDFMQNSAIAYSQPLRMMTAQEAALIEGPHTAPPRQVTATARGGSSVEVSWQGGSEGDYGYKVYIMKEGQDGYVPLDVELAKGQTSCLVEGLSPGLFYFAVQALAEPLAESSVLARSAAVRLQDPLRMPVINEVKTTYAYALINYTLKGGAYSEYGLCLSEGGLPDAQGLHIWGPSLPANRTVSQLIPNAVLDQEKDYRLCVYAKSGEAVLYSEPVTLRLPPEPAAPALVWTRVPNPDSVPSCVEVYATQTPLGGRPFKAWYAIADCSSDVELKVCAPSSLTTIDKMSESYGGNCYALINGGYFDWSSSWSSPYVADGRRVGEGYGSSRVSDGSWTLATPAVLGVDRQGRPAAYWWSARPSKAYYYNLPHPTVPDAAKYWYESSDAQLSAFPGPDQKWEPYNAISAGPMVLYDGKVVVDDSHNGSWYTTNYELLASDIFPGSRPDRTAIGYTADGRVVLFVCDGRVDESDGASLPELGLIMKSIGCVAAQNLDGGGSTGMMFGPEHLNTWYQGKGTARRMEYRAVRNAVGFFRK